MKRGRRGRRQERDPGRTESPARLQAETEKAARPQPCEIQCARGGGGNLAGVIQEGKNQQAW